MEKIVDYFMTPVSPFVYLGHARFREICAKHQAKINLRVMDLGKVFPVSGGLALKDRPPQRRAYRMMELKRWRDLLGMPLTLEPKHFPVPAEPAATLILAVLERHGTTAALDIAGDCGRAVWAEERNISDASVLAEIVSARKLDAGCTAGARTLGRSRGALRPAFAGGDHAQCVRRTDVHLSGRALLGAGSPRVSRSALGAVTRRAAFFAVCPRGLEPRFR